MRGVESGGAVSAGYFIQTKAEANQGKDNFPT